MKICARVDNPAAVLRQRLEALASQLAELETLRDRVDRERSARAAPVALSRTARELECNRAAAATSQI